MSTIANKIQEGMGKDRQQNVIIRSPVLSTFTQEHSEIRSSPGFVEGIKSQFGFSMLYSVVTERGADQRGAGAYDMAQRQIIEALYGEFRAPIMKIYEHLSVYDVKGAAQSLAHLESLMFTSATEVQG